MPGKNEIIELAVTAVSHEGNGVGRHTDGMVVFVPLTAPGDLARVKVVKAQKHHAYGMLLELLSPSPYREEQSCPVYSRCGGCSLRHIGYEQELEIKAGWLRENLLRIGGADIVPEPIVASPSRCRYRNKAQYPVRLVDGAVRVGFFAKRSHRILPIRDCLLQPAFFADICATVTAFLEEYGIRPYEEASHTGLVRHLFIRHAEATGQVMVCLVLNGKTLPHAEMLTARLREACPGLSSLVLNQNTARTNAILGERTQVLYGSPYVEDVLCGVRLRISPHAFYQVNRVAAALLYKAALEYAAPTPGDTLLDLYCGVGAVGLSMAGHAGAVMGVEVVPQAVEDARQNAAQNGLQNARFLCADAAEATERLLAEGLRPDIVLLDPPRKGVDASLIRCVRELAPRRVVYISCNSATLARDCKLFGEVGYPITKARAVDLFPRTAHVEAVALLERAGD